MRARITGAVLLASLAAGSPAAADWLVAAGPTRSDGAAIEVARVYAAWEVAAGYVGAQQVTVRTLQATCSGQPGSLTDCVNQATVQDQEVDEFAYLSLQRRFRLPQRGSWLRPYLGLGLAGQTDTNPYVSSPVNFSLSLALNVGQRSSVEWRHFSNAGLQRPNLGQDMLMLRWQF
jgi:hypothetical protein